MPTAQRGGRSTGKGRASRARPVKARTSKAGVDASGRDGLDGLDAVELAKQTLQVICRDAEAPAAARAQSARTLLELAGALRLGGSTDTRAPSELSLAEIDERLATLGNSGVSEDADTKLERLRP